MTNEEKKALKCEIIDQLKAQFSEQEERFDIRKALRSKGANDQQLGSKTVSMIEEIIAENNGELPAGATGKADRLIAALENAERKTGNLQRDLAGQLDEAREIAERLNVLSDNAKATVVTDERDAEALKVFASALDIVKVKIPEEARTESVWERGIEAASYMAWRSIMGPKYPDDDTGKSYKARR